MRNYFYIFLIIFVLIPAFAKEKTARQNESFDPMELNEPSLPFMDGTMIYEIITDINKPIIMHDFSKDTLHVVEKMGWKVQVFSTRDFYEADTVYKQVLNSFEDEEVEKVFNSPYYKIRVGNCETREEAENLLDKSLELNYYKAWIMRTRVKVKEKVFSY
ncbi:MAG: SPOR domain-containing protein [Candidatus Marinimicrobia bacterium]|nr:SPOR domain-containing protein [Candidatus Neomarinimicrobiota bacterium]